MGELGKSTQRGGGKMYHAFISQNSPRLHPALPPTAACLHTFPFSPLQNLPRETPEGLGVGMLPGTGEGLLHSQTACPDRF